MDAALERQVRQRAHEACEYCRMPQAYDSLPFHIDHIIARKHGGASLSGNLALACYNCNLHKGPNVAGIDPETGRITRLFHPREDNWAAVFQWHGARLVGRTDVGRTTVAVLEINRADRVAHRIWLIAEGFVFKSD
jgi:hypothetical protein